MNVGSFFSGAGLLDCGLAQAGLEHSWLCEVDEFRRGLLARRWPDALILDDVRAVGADSVPRVDVAAGAFPCRGASTAGKRDGLANDQTVLWHEMARAVRELQPRYVLIENVANILTMAAEPGQPPGSLWGTVLGDLAEIGYDIEWDCLPAAAVGAPHLRDRVFAIASYTDGEGREVRPEQPSGVPGDRQSGLDRGDQDAPDSGGEGERGDGRGREGSRQRLDAGADAASPAHTQRGRCAAEQPNAEGGREAPGAAQRHGEAAAEAGTVGQRVGSCVGVDVEWGDFEAAIRRWEQIHGPAPAPLTGVRGLDDGDPVLRRMRARVDRSRLSALGDGVHVYVGYLAGRRLVELEEQRMSVAA